MRSTWWALAIVAGLTLPVAAQTPARGSTEREIAAAFAPIFHQGMVGSRYDFITNIDFDGDWVGDNNWDNAAKPEFPQRGYVYYAVSETADALLHPLRGVSSARLQGRRTDRGDAQSGVAPWRARVGRGFDRPRSLTTSCSRTRTISKAVSWSSRRRATLADSDVVIVETLAHNRYLKYQREATLSGNVGAVRVRRTASADLHRAEGARHRGVRGPAARARFGRANQCYRWRPRRWPRRRQPDESDDDATRPVGAASSPGGPATADSSSVAVPAGGGLVDRITGFVSRVEEARRVLNREQPEFIRVYRYTGTAADPEKTEGDIGYDLLPTFETMWARAHRVPNETYGETQDYGRREIRVAGVTATVRTTTIGPLGSSFRGVQGAENKARPPWGWFDMSERDRPLGEWFLDPAAAVQRHFPSSAIDVHYVHQPFLGITRTP